MEPLLIADTTYSNVPEGTEFKPTHIETWGMKGGRMICYRKNIATGETEEIPLLPATPEEIKNAFNKL